MLLEIVFSSLTILFSLFLAYIVWRSIYVNVVLRNVPTPPLKPIIGHIATFNSAKTVLKELRDIQEAYGGVARFWAFYIFNVLVITDQKLLELILNGTKILNKGREYIFFERWLGTGLLTAPPEKWKKTRKIITPTFHFQILEQFIEIFHSASDILIERLKNETGKEINIYPFVTLCALDVICESAMGVKIHAQEKSNSEYVRNVQLLSKVIRKRIFYPVINIFYYFSIAYRREKKALKVIHGHTYTVIKQRRDALKRNKGQVNQTDPSDEIDEITLTRKKRRLAFLDLLLESTIDDRPMTDEEIREEVDTFMFEGHDTTSSALAFTLYLLSTHKDVQDKVIDELKAIFGDDQRRMATSEDMNEMRYLEMVIKESLRLYPPVPFISRRLMRDTEYEKGTLPKLTTLGISIINLHRDPSIYEEPDKFDPERFTLENQQMRGPFSYIPFSAGPRNCIGQRFAMMELKSTLTKVLRNFEILPLEGFEVKLVPDAILKSLNGVKMILRDRKF